MSNSDFLDEFEDLTNGIKKNLMKMRRTFGKYNTLLKEKSANNFQVQIVQIMTEDLTVLKNYSKKLKKTSKHQAIFEDILAQPIKPSITPILNSVTQTALFKKPQLLRSSLVNCEFCNLETTFSGLGYHLRQRHGKKRVCVCPICQKQFNNASSLSKHIKEHNPKKRLYFVCPFTDQTFCGHHLLQKHIANTPAYHAVVSWSPKLQNREKQKEPEGMIEIQQQSSSVGKILLEEDFQMKEQIMYEEDLIIIDN